jgi:fermentation-respiration switch protein FrsA (DUF1100 family)
MALGRHTKLRQVCLLALLAILLTAMRVNATLEHHFIYFPDATQVATPALYDLPFQDVTFPASDGTRLNGWLIPGQAGQPLVLFCMGNAGNMSHRLDNLLQLHRLGVSLFIFDYRGYGQSAGRASEEGTYADIRGALTWLDTQGWQAEQMIFFGRSLGAAVALQAALEKPPAGVILESPFSSIRSMGNHHYPGLALLLGWLISADYDNLGKISALQSPLLIFHGTEDTICPPAMAEELFAQAPHPKQLVWLAGAGHNNTVERGGEHYWDSWQTFLLQAMASHADRPSSGETKR